MIELTSPVIGYVDTVHPMLAGDGGIFGRGDTFENEGNVVCVLEALHLVPGERGLPAHAGGGLPPRLDEALVDVALAPTVVRGVDRHAEEGVAVVLRALDVIVHEGVVTTHVELEDAVIVGGLGGGFEPRIAGARQHVRYAEGSRGLARGRSSAGREAFHRTDGSEHHREPHVTAEESG